MGSEVHSALTSSGTRTKVGHTVDGSPRIAGAEVKRDASSGARMRPVSQRRASAAGLRPSQVPVTEAGSRSVFEILPHSDGLRPSAVQQAFDDPSPGQPINGALRSQLEVEVGSDFSGVRVHADGEAARLAANVEADAFTRGNHVYFGAGRYEPGTTVGLRLLRHELGHVMQQARGDVLTYAGRVVPQEHASEAQAASGIALQGPSRSANAPGVSIQRQPSKRPLSKNEADYFLWVLDDVIYNESSRLIPDLTDRYRGAFEKLFGGIAGHDLSRRKIAGRERREIFDEAVLALREVLAYASEEQRGALRHKRTALLETEAADRVESSIIIDKKIVEIPDDRHADEQAKVIQEILLKLDKTLQLANEQLHRLAEGTGWRVPACCSGKSTIR